MCAYYTLGWYSSWLNAYISTTRVAHDDHDHNDYRTVLSWVQGYPLAEEMVEFSDVLFANSAIQWRA